MSILDGNVVLDGESRIGKNNRNGKKNNNRNERNTGGRNRDSRRYEDVYSEFGGSSYLPDDVRGNSYEEKDDGSYKNDNRANSIMDFCDTFADNVQNYKTLQELVSDDFPEVINYIRAYYSNKNNSSFVDALNKLIKTMCTTPFANVLSRVLETGIWTEDDTYDRIWSSIAFGLSIALETSYDRMHSDVIAKYVSTILPRMWKPEITDVAMQTGVTKDLALDLFIAIPMANDDWSGANIDAFYHRFLDKMIIHAEDNMDILNWEVQGMLYERIFGKSKTALKVIGKYLTSESVTTFESDVEEAVYNDFKKMLYSKLDAYDIKDIEYVFSFVAKFSKDNPDKDIIFDPIIASNYENVRKGLFNVIDKNPDAKKCLA